MPQDYKPFHNVPTYSITEDYADSDLVCAKCFVIDRSMVYGAVITAVMDGNDARELTVNGFDTSRGQVRMGPQHWTEAFSQIFDERGRTTWFDLPAISVGGEPIEIGLVDIVTYPWLFGITRQIDAPKLCWEINHNILAPFVEGLTGWMGVWTSIHFNEQPIDDAPAHNLMVFAPQLSPALRRQEAERLFQHLPTASIIPVTNEQRVMDSRCALLKRGPQDAPVKPLTQMRADQVVPQLVRRRES